MGTQIKQPDQSLDAARSAIGLGALVKEYTLTAPWALCFGTLVGGAIHELALRMNCSNTTIYLATAGGLGLGGRLGNLLDDWSKKHRRKPKVPKNRQLPPGT